MKLNKLHLNEEQCIICKTDLVVDNYAPRSRNQCKKCAKIGQKTENRKKEEELNFRDRADSFTTNLTHVVHQMPDRGHDIKRGTPGFVMGEPSPGRSF